MNKQIYLIGAGGHSKVLMSVMKRLKIKVSGVIDNDDSIKDFLGVPVIGGDQEALKLDNADVELVNGIGSTKNLSLRKKIFNYYKERGFNFKTLIDPFACITCDVEIGEGAQIMAGSVLQPCVKVGDNTIINTKASIDHDSVVGKHCHIAPGVTISGNVTIGSSCHVGTGVNIIQGVEIGSQTLVAAGSIVIKNIGENKLVIGSKPEIKDNPYLG